MKELISTEGFAIINKVYTDKEVNDLLKLIAMADSANENFRQSNDLFAIRRFFKEIPLSQKIVFNEKLLQIKSELFGSAFFVVKSIYFDKPANSNWFVSYHQDLTIAVDKKHLVAGYGPWTTKQNQFAVQPPVEILKDNFTIRIHLDDTTEENAALRVVPASHLKGICRPEKINWSIEKQTICTVEKGGIMIMKPLLLHSSGRTTNNKKRRVLHIEFSKSILPTCLNWAEYLPLKELPDYERIITNC